MASYLVVASYRATFGLAASFLAASSNLATSSNLAISSKLATSKLAVRSCQAGPCLEYSYIAIPYQADPLYCCCMAVMAIARSTHLVPYSFASMAMAAHHHTSLLHKRLACQSEPPASDSSSRLP